VAAAGEHGEARADLGFVDGLGQDAAADGDDGVGGQGELARLMDDRGLFGGQAAGMQARELVAAGCLVDVGGGDAIGGDADLGQEGEPAGARRGEDEGRYLNRNVMRPLLRS
jgi:hypothetical protein